MIIATTGGGGGGGGSTCIALRNHHHMLGRQIGLPANQSVQFVDTLLHGAPPHCSHNTVAWEDIAITAISATSGSTLVGRALDIFAHSRLCSHVAKVIVVISDEAAMVDTELMSIALSASLQSGVHVCVQAGLEGRDPAEHVLLPPRSYRVRPGSQYELVQSCASFLVSLLSEL